jgi:hypothetical protein
MPSDEFDERERALHYAARLKGLSLVRTGDTFALAQVTDATLDEIAAFLGSDERPEGEHGRGDRGRRADLRALLRAERALIVEFEDAKRTDGERSPKEDTPETALADIRRRIDDLLRNCERPGQTLSSEDSESS